MTDFFDELERELRRAHRRDTERHARSRVFDLRRLSGLPAAGLRAVVALAVVVAVVAVVLAVVRESGVERLAAPPPQPSLTPAPGVLGCVPSDWWEAPIVDEPIPREIASRFATFRDHPRPSGELPRDVRNFRQAKKLYRGALTLRPRLDTGTRLHVVMIAADAIPSHQGDHDFCAPPPDPIEPSICVAAFAPNGTMGEAKCFSIDEIENAEGWFSMARTTADPWGPQRRPVVGLAPDGVDRVTFDTATGPKSLNVSGNVFAGEIRSTDKPFYTDARFAP
jgi:hypothetical protein